MPMNAALLWADAWMQGQEIPAWGQQMCTKVRQAQQVRVCALHAGAVAKAPACAKTSTAGERTGGHVWIGHVLL